MRRIERKTGRLVEDVAGKHLLDGDASGDWSLRFRHQDVQDAVFQTGLDAILVDALREGEGALELADRTLGKPVFGLGFGLLCDLGAGGIVGGGYRRRVVLFFFDGGRVV